ncbi:MAG: hypothetical protein ACREPM_13150, partial [Gemmatimonadaceae bacterium]
MKETLVQARMGLDDLRGGLDKARERLAAEERELETTRRRKQLAEGINDRETVGLAVKYEQMHAERAEVLKQRVAAQEAELALAERDVAQMSQELKAVLAGTDPRAHAAVTDAAGGVGAADAGDSGASHLRDEL